MDSNMDLKPVPLHCGYYDWQLSCPDQEKETNEHLSQISQNNVVVVFPNVIQWNVLESHDQESN